MSAQQLDLFGEVEAAETEQATAERASVQRRAAFLAVVTVHPDGTPVLWTAPYDTQGGLLKGETCPGWRCPHCGLAEPNEFWLSLNHAVYEQYVSDWDGTRTECGRQQLLANQAAAARERGAA